MQTSFVSHDLSGLATNMVAAGPGFPFQPHKSFFRFIFPIDETRFAFDNDVPVLPAGFLPIRLPDSAPFRWAALGLGKKAVHLFASNRFQGCRFLTWRLADISGLGRRAVSTEDLGKVAAEALSAAAGEANADPMQVPAVVRNGEELDLLLRGRMASAFFVAPQAAFAT